MRVARSAVAVVLLTLVGSACGGSDGAADEPVEIVEIVDDVSYYPGCSNEPVEIAGTTWYPVPEWGDDTAKLYGEITSVVRQDSATPQGFAPDVATPGPGDDAGTLVVYADGYGRYETDSGKVTWLTTEEQTYNWIC